MNLDELRQRLLGEVDDMIDRRVASLANIRFRPVMVVDGTVSAASTAEEIALMTIEHTSEIRTLRGARLIINDTINKMLAPAQQPTPADETQQEMY